jgi:glucose/arabinose dehydrogenase
MRYIKTLLLAAPFSAALAQDPVTIQLNLWATNLNRPTDIAHCGDSRLFITLQEGYIRIITDSMQVVTRPFLDIHNQVLDNGNEQGLLGLAFDPDYANNGFFYTHYTRGTGSGISRVSRWTVSSDPDSADVTSEQVLFEWPQPYTNHNGGIWTSVRTACSTSVSVMAAAAVIRRTMHKTLLIRWATCCVST